MVHFPTSFPLILHAHFRSRSLDYMTSPETEIFILSRRFCVFFWRLVNYVVWVLKVFWISNHSTFRILPLEFQSKAVSSWNNLEADAETKFLDDFCFYEEVIQETEFLCHILRSRQLKSSTHPRALGHMISEKFYISKPFTKPSHKKQVQGGKVKTLDKNQ